MSIYSTLPLVYKFKYFTAYVEYLLFDILKTKQF